MDQNKLWKILNEMRIPRKPYLLPENPASKSTSNSENWTWNNELVPNWERSMSSLYIVILLL